MVDKGLEFLKERLRKTLIGAYIGIICLTLIGGFSKIFRELYGIEGLSFLVIIFIGILSVKESFQFLFDNNFKREEYLKILMKFFIEVGLSFLGILIFQKICLGYKFMPSIWGEMSFVCMAIYILGGITISFFFGAINALVIYKGIYNKWVTTVHIVLSFGFGILTMKIIKGLATPYTINIINEFYNERFLIVGLLGLSIVFFIIVRSLVLKMEV